MVQQPKSDKHLVSKGQYVRTQVGRTYNSLIGVIYILMGILFGAMAITLLLALVYHLCFPTRDFLLNSYVFKDRGKDPFNALMGTLFFNSVILIMLGGLTYVLSTFGFDILKASIVLDPGIPFTRANAASLSAPESLVRAGEEPRQEQQAVLLRAAIQGQETPAEQLVRATAGQHIETESRKYE